MSQGRKWTDDDIEQLKQLYTEGTPITRICAETGHHRETVRIWLAKLGLRTPRKGPARQPCPWEAEAVEMYKNGMNCERIGKALGKDGSTIRSRLRTIGIWTPPKRLKPNPKKSKYESESYQRPNNEHKEDLPLRPCRGVLCNGAYKFKPESRYVFRCFRCREAVRGQEDDAYGSSGFRVANRIPDSGGQRN
jgi:hypothetical protein